MSPALRHVQPLVGALLLLAFALSSIACDEDNPPAGDTEPSETVADTPEESDTPDDTADVEPRDTTAIDGLDAIDIPDVLDATGDTPPSELPDLSGDSDGSDTVFPPLPSPTREGIIIGVDETFWHNMDDLVFNIAADYDVKLYLTVISANFYGREENRALGMELVRNPESFLENAVVPLLERYEDTGVIWAIDCMNEPEALVAGDSGNWSEWGVSWDEMQAYLSACADVVHSHSDLMVSAGSGWHDWTNIQAGRFTGLGFDFYDYHVYHDAMALPSAASLGGAIPVVVGECGQGSDQRNDTLQLSAVRGCFDQAEAGGYLAALSWYYDYPGSENKHAHINANGTWRPVRAAVEEHATSSLLAGINLAWFAGAYDHDIGLNPIHPDWGVRYQHDEVAAIFADLDTVGVPLMRMWAFEGQEALPFHVVFEDFEEPSSWGADGVNVALRESSQHAVDGDHSLAIHIAATEPGWYGVSRAWSPQALLNLSYGNEWTLSAHNALGVPVGVNLAFVTDGVTYQTRSGAVGGQLWLENGASGERTVALNGTGFSEQWALSSAPDQGAAVPTNETLAQVSELRVRVYLSAAQVPVEGDLFIDAVRIR